MNAGKFDEIYKLLAKNTLKITSNLPNKLKCCKCEKILINACQGPCGCRYCRVCIDEWLASSCLICPGVSGMCKETDLSSFHTDFTVNIKISKLVAKCPEETCSFESEIFNMNDHLRVCPNKSLKCVFHGYGCEEENLALSSMNEHLKLENYGHMKMFIGLYDNMRNEVDHLNESESGNKSEIVLLKENELKYKNEIRILKQELLKNRGEMKSLEEDIDIIKEKNICVLKKDIEENLINIIREMSEMRKSWTDDLNSYQTNMEIRLYSAEKWMDKQIDGIFVWTIDKVSERRKNHECVRSEYFYGRMQPYKMTLALNLNGIGDVNGTGLSIIFCVHADDRNSSLQWPFKANVTMKITNKATPENCKMMAKYCIMERPGNNSTKMSEAFKFNYLDLSSASLLVDNCFIVECLTDQL